MRGVGDKKLTPLCGGEVEAFIEEVDDASDRLYEYVLYARCR